MQEQIVAVGVDLCGINRFKKYLTHQKFLEKIFSNQELLTAFDQAYPSCYLAKCWAAKESFIKALHESIFRFNLPMLSVDVFSQQWQLDRCMVEVIESQSITEIFLSIEERHEMAVAVTILKKSSA